METVTPAEVVVETLGNGLELLVLPEHANPVASLQMWVRSGSVHEGAHLGSGLSHLIEHLVFKATASYGPGEAARAVQEAGGYLNAYTSFERTVYLADVPAEGVAACLGVLAELVFHPRFPESEFEREMDVIRREIAMGDDDPRRVLAEELFATAFQAHPCRHPVIGRLGAFNRLTLNDVRAFHASRYTPNNVFVVVAGDVDPDEIRCVLEEKLGNLTAAAVPGVALPGEPPQAAARRRCIPFGTRLTRFDLAWHIPSQTHPDTPSLDLLGRILGNGQSFRLFRKVREQSGLAHDIGAGAYSPGFGGLFFLDAECDPEKADDLEAAMLAEVAALAGDGVSTEELEKARRSVLADFFHGLESTHGLASQIGASWLLTGTPDFPSTYVAGLQAVTAEKVRSVAESYLRPAGMTSVRVVPRSEGAVTRARPAPRVIADLREVTLPNGLRLLLGVDRRLPMVSIQAGFRGGAGTDRADRAGRAAWLAASLWKGSTRTSGPDLANLIEGRGGRFGASAGNNSLLVEARGLASDFTCFGECLAEILRGPSFPAEAVERERAALVAEAAECDQQPLRLAMRETRRRVFAGTPYAEPAAGTTASLAALTAEDLRAGHASHAAGTNGVVGVFGDFDPVAAEEACRGWFGDLPAGRDAFAAASLPRPPVPGSETTLFLDKEQAVLVVAFPTDGIHDADSTAQDLLDEACGDMASRFFLRIREEQGLAYYVSPFQTKGWRAGAFGFYLGTSVEKLAHAEAEVLDEIRRLATDGPDPAELERAKRTWRGKFLLHNQSSDARGRRSLVDVLFGFPSDHAHRQLEEARAMDAATVRAACARLLSRPPVVVRVRPDPA